MNPAPDLLNTYHKAEALLVAGELRQAADLCKSLLDTNPEFPYGYHLMSSLFTATGTFEKALTFAQLAVHMAPTVPAFHLQRGQVLSAIEQWEQASTAFEQAYLLDLKNPMPLLLWGWARAQLRQYDDALELIACARSVYDIPQVDEYEGICRAMRGETEQAELLFDRLIVRAPDYAPGYVHKGNLLMNANHTTLAEASFARALKYDANAEGALFGMALLHVRQGHPEIAIRYAMQAMQAHPRSWRCHMLLGSLLTSQPHDRSAEQVLEQAHLLMPDNLYVLHMLVGMLLRKQKQPEALRRVEALLAANSDQEALRHMRSMLKGDMAPGAPRDYITRLFDGYAGRFDPHAQPGLAQKLPLLLAEKAREHFSDPHALSLLDLGCGTGVTAYGLQDITGVRIGVDLSERMLDRARATSLYTELYPLDMIEFMQASDRTFDLVTAVDVLMHSGNLVAFLQQSRAVLKSSGLLAFTIEKEFLERNAPKQGFRLQPTGRYIHSARHVLSLAEEHGYDLLAQEDVVLRTEHYVPLHGVAFIFKKIQTH